MGPVVLRKMISPPLHDNRVSAEEVFNIAAEQLIVRGMLEDLPALFAPDDIITAARHSYLHENEFAKVTLASSLCDRFRLRLHHWPSGEYEVLPNVHNHRFRMVSRLLSGTLRNVTWNVCEGDEFCRFRYLPRQGAEQYLMQYVGQAGLLLSSEERLIKGNVYAQDAEVLHTSHPGSSLVTLFLEDRQNLRPYADVFSKRYPKHDTELQSPAMSPDRFLSTLSSILHGL